MIIQEGNKLRVTFYLSKANRLDEEIKEVRNAIGDSYWSWSKKNDDPLEFEITLKEGDTNSKAHLESLFNFSRTVSAFYSNVDPDAIFNKMR